MGSSQTINPNPSLVIWSLCRSMGCICSKTPAQLETVPGYRACEPHAREVEEPRNLLSRRAGTQALELLGFQEERTAEDGAKFSTILRSDRGRSASSAPGRQGNVLDVEECAVSQTDGCWRSPLCCWTHGGSWEEEVAQTSDELKRKLRDPHFVAQRCDLDGSGDLDMHELKQATRTFGLRFLPRKLEELMLRPRISKHEFADIICKYSDCLSESCKTVPHSLRGMALGQAGASRSFVCTVGLAGHPVRHLQRGERTRHPRKQDLPASLQPVCVEHFCGHADVQARDLCSPSAGSEPDCASGP